MKMEELNVFRQEQYIKVSPNDKESLNRCSALWLWISEESLSF